MTHRERDLIVCLARRLREAGPPDRDCDAERLILDEIGLKPDAVYQLAQTAIALELALRQAEARIERLESGKAGLLAGLFGGRPAGPASPPADGAGLFLRTAATTAAGVAGGWLVADGLRHLLDAPPYDAPGGVEMYGPAGDCDEPDAEPVAADDEFGGAELGAGD